MADGETVEMTCVDESDKYIRLYIILYKYEGSQWQFDGGMYSENSCGFYTSPEEARDAANRFYGIGCKWKILTFKTERF